MPHVAVLLHGLLTKCVLRYSIVPCQFLLRFCTTACRRSASCRIPSYPTILPRTALLTVLLVRCVGKVHLTGLYVRDTLRVVVPVYSSNVPVYHSGVPVFRFDVPLCRANAGVYVLFQVSAQAPGGSSRRLCEGRGRAKVLLPGRRGYQACQVRRNLFGA